MITNVKEENGCIFVERDNGLTSSISLNSPTGDGQLERWDNNYVYVRTGDYRLTYNEAGCRINTESAYHLG